MPHRRIAIVALVTVALFGGARSVAEDEPKEQGPFARGFGYLGAFWVTQSSTEVRLFSTDLPLGARLNVQKDLGVRDSFVVPRMTLGWRFGKRHMFSGAYYDLSRTGVSRLETTIELPGDIEFDAGVEVANDILLRVGKLQYTDLFHRDEKVSLGIGVLASTDWFLLTYSDRFKGTLSDTQIYAAHRTFKHVGFAGGLNVQTFNVESTTTTVFSGRWTPVSSGSWGP